MTLQNVDGTIDGMSFELSSCWKMLIYFKGSQGRLMWQPVTHVPENLYVYSGYPGHVTGSLHTKGYTLAVSLQISMETHTQ